VVYQIVSFSMTFSDPNPSFKVTVFFESEYLKTVCLREKSFYRTLIGNHGYSVEWYQFDDLDRKSVICSEREGLLTSNLVHWWNTIICITNVRGDLHPTWNLWVAVQVTTFRRQGWISVAALQTAQLMIY